MNENDISAWNVLVVDDEPDNVGVIELVMDYHNATIRTATTAVQCLEMLEETIPSVLLLDIQMPDMSGFELLEKVKADERWQDILAIAVTAHAMAGDKERIIAAGFDGYIPKPVNAMTLVNDIMEIMKSKEKQ